MHVPLGRDAISIRTHSSPPSARVGKLCSFQRSKHIFAQGDPADAVFYLQTGKVRLTVVSKTGKEATIGILSDGSFFGEGCARRSSSSHGLCNRNDGLRCSAD